VHSVRIIFLGLHLTGSHGAVTSAHVARRDAQQCIRAVASGASALHFFQILFLTRLISNAFAKSERADMLFLTNALKGGTAVYTHTQRCHASLMVARCHCSLMVARCHCNLMVARCHCILMVARCHCILMVARCHASLMVASSAIA
jgi:hypothetical protein